VYCLHVKLALKCFAVAIVILAVYVSYYVVITVGMLMIALPIAAVLGRRFGTYRLNIQKSGDRRLKLTNELLQGIRIVKYYAWENAFRDNIEANRDEELKSVLGLSISRALLIFIMRYSTVIAVAITLVSSPIVLYLSLLIER
jgi:ATP-binding cassette subfamily C (CFTR/MRP) protein 1